MKESFVETHAHLAHNFAYSEWDKVADSGLVEQIWLHAIDCVHSPRHSGNQAVLEVARHYPGLVKPFAFCRLDGSPDQVAAFKDAGFSGLKFIYPVADYDNPSFFPIYEQAEKYEMPCFFHVGIIAKRTSDELLFPGQLASPRRMRPCMLDTLSAEFPHLKIIAGHMGVPWCNELFETLWYYPNVRCCICGFSDYQYLLKFLNSADSEHVPYYRKLMFASDAAYGTPGVFDTVVRRAIFFREFFTEIGADAPWATCTEQFMKENALTFLSRL